MFRTSWFLLVFLLVPAAVRAQDPLTTAVDAIMDGPDYKTAHWGALVVDAKTGKVLYARNADKLFTPASVTKLYSCAAALVAFGPDHTVETPVFARGTIANGVLKGDLILVGKGDLDFGGRTRKDGTLAFTNADHTYAGTGSTPDDLTETDPLLGLTRLAEQIKKLGITEVTGEILIDDRLFAPARGTGSGPDAVSPVVLNDNLIDVIVVPGAKAGEPAKVAIRPDLTAIARDVEVATGSTTNLTVRFDGQNLVVRGTVGDKPALRIAPVDNPPAFARMAFIELLRKQGIRVRANLHDTPAKALPSPEEMAKLEKVASYTSAKLSETLKVTLKVSHNLYASTLPCLLAAKNGKTTLADGISREGAILKELGVDTKTISFAGGAGGAWADCVTPRATVQLMQAMRKRDDWKQYQAMLPSLGVDGTLAKVVDEKSPARGKVFAKTGTLSYTDSTKPGSTLLRSKALAGVMTTDKGTELTFALFVNNVVLPAGVLPAREGKVLGRICEAIYQHGP